MKSKVSSGKTKKQLVKKIDFVTALSQDDCIRRLFASSGKPVFANKTIDVVTVDNRFIISVQGLLPSSTTNDPTNPRTVREAQCVGTLEPVENGTRVVAKAKFYADYETTQQDHQASLFLDLLIFLIDLVICVVNDHMNNTNHTPHGHPPDFAQWLYNLLFELESEPK